MFEKLKRLGVIIMAAALLATTGCNDSNDVKEPQKEQENNIQLSTESPLMNTYKLLTNEKKLTIGYIGGSITFGTSAGDVRKSWSYLVSDWFSEQFPEATIETVNAGVSDTATNFGIYRLEKDLMNTNGHDMPDLVFVEFTSNDFTYASQGEEELKLQIESIILNIWKHNPNAEIIAVSTNTSKVVSRTLYENVFEYYGLPFIDVGFPLRSAMREKKTDLAGSTYYYTTDNLHPSARGYEVYLGEIVEALKPLITNLAPKDKELTDYSKTKPETLSKNLILTPKIVPAEKLKLAGAAQLTDKPITLSQFGTQIVRTGSEFTPSSVQLSGKSTVTAEFSGTALGIATQLGEVGFEMRWKVDDGEWKEFAVNAKSWAFQRYNHAQVFMMEHNLSEGKHTVVIEFTENTNIRLGGLLVNN